MNQTQNNNEIRKNGVFISANGSIETVFYERDPLAATDDEVDLLSTSAITADGDEVELLSPPALATRVEHTLEIEVQPKCSESPVFVEMQTPNSENKDYTENVTIEGEGNFQVLEVEFPEKNAEEANKPVAAVKAFKKMTLEEERAVAMEQMELLETAASVRKRKSSAAAKKPAATTVAKTQKAAPAAMVPVTAPIVNEANNTGAVPNLISQLRADWSDEDDTASTSAGAVLNKTVKMTAAEPTVIFAIPEKPAAVPATVASPAINVEKTYTFSSVSTTMDAAGCGGERGRRVVKRKIIWDPDVPETHLSFAGFARTNQTVARGKSANNAVTADSNVIIEKHLKAVGKGKTVKKTAEDSLPAKAKANTDEPLIIRAQYVSKARTATSTKRTLPMIPIPVKIESRKTMEMRAKYKAKLAELEAKSKSVSARKKYNAVVNKTKAQKLTAAAKKMYFENEQVNSMIVRSHSESSSSADECEISFSTMVSEDLNISDSENAPKKLEREPKLMYKSRLKTKHINGTPYTVNPGATLPQDDDCGVSGNWLNGDTSGFVYGDFEPLYIHQRQHKGIWYVCMEHKLHNKVNHPRNYTITVKGIQYLASSIEKFNAWESARALVLYTKTADNFLCGIDYEHFLQENSWRCADSIKNLNVALRRLYTALAQSKMPLIAGVYGKISGFTVNMLSLFDVVIAHENVECSVNFGPTTHGLYPVGYCLLNSSNSVNQALKTQLFYLNRKAYAADLYPSIVHQIVKNDVPKAVKIALLDVLKMPKKHYAVLKQGLSDTRGEVLRKQLKKEERLLEEQWTSPEFIEKFTQKDVTEYENARNDVNQQ